MTVFEHPIPCPVCLLPNALPFMVVAKNSYWRCSFCEATFLDPKQRLRRDQELAHYRHHQNDPGDARYRAFLSKLAEPLLAKLESGMSGLDYGCGPGPALSTMFEEAGMSVALHDPFFCPNPAALQQRYDVIMLSEVAEHFFDPAGEFKRLGRLLGAGGWLGVMTSFQTDDESFANWHYRRDPTHVVFYRPRTFEVIAQHRSWKLEIPSKDVALFQKR